MAEDLEAILEQLRIFQVRDRPVVLDSDLAAVYQVETKVFNQAFKRNRDRFPEDFAFQLTQDEWEALRSQIVTLKKGRGRHRKYRPWVFTEHGAIMAATMLNSDRAIAMSVYVVRAFVQMREELLTTALMEKRLAEIEKTLASHDGALTEIFELIRPLISPPEEPKRRIGFRPPEESE